MAVLGAAPRNQWRVEGGRVDLSRAVRTPRRVAFSATPQDLALDLNRTAILVIDMQNDFCAPGGWMDGRGVTLAPARALFEPLNRLIAALRRAAVPVVWIRWAVRPDRFELPPGVLHAGNRDGAQVGYGDPTASGKGPALQSGAWGTEICPELAVAPGDLTVDKVRFSGFWHNELDAILRNLDVTTLMFAGVNLDRCVLATLQDASFLGYDCILVEDCVATVSPDYCTQAVRFLVQTLYGFLAPSTAIRNALDAAEPASP